MTAAFFGTGCGVDEIPSRPGHGVAGKLRVADKSASANVWTNGNKSICHELRNLPGGHSNILKNVGVLGDGAGRAGPVGRAARRWKFSAARLAFGARPDPGDEVGRFTFVGVAGEN